MKNYMQLMEESLLSLKTADHMAYMTYPIVQDPQLVITIAEKLYSSLLQAIRALLSFDYAYKRIDYFPLGEQDQLRLFRETSMSTHRINERMLKLLQDLTVFVEFRKRSTLDLTQDNHVFLVHKSYPVRSLPTQKIKQFVRETKQYIVSVEEIIHHGL